MSCTSDTDDHRWERRIGTSRLSKSDNYKEIIDTVLSELKQYTYYNISIIHYKKNQYAEQSGEQVNTDPMHVTNNLVAQPL